MSYESVILILFVIASAVAVIARRINLPYTIALVAVGLALGAFHLLHPPSLTQELLYTVFLPPLIFEAAIHLRASELWRDGWPIATLVIPGVIASTLLTAAVMVPVSIHFAQIDAITWPVGILFGAAVAATDPVAVVSLFNKLGAPRRLRLLIESESLLNDGTSIVVFILAMQYILGHLDTPQDAVVDFFRIVGLGLLVGIVVGLATSAVMHHVDDAMITITLTTIAAYGSFLIADKLGVSGVMSTVAAGLITGEKGLSETLFPSIRIATETFWEYIAFAMNSLIFLLMGFAVNLTLLWELFPIVLIAYGSVLTARFFVVTGTWALFYPSKHKFPFSWAAVMTWGGLRGALSMVLALSIPDSFALKELIVTLVFGVVLISIFVQGMTMSPLMKILGILSPVSQLKNYELLKTEISLYQDTIDTIEKLHKRHLLSAQSLEALTNEYQKKIDALSEALDNTEVDKETLLKEEVLKTKRRMIMEETKGLLERYRSGIISLEVYKTIKNEFDSQLFELENMGA